MRTKERHVKTFVCKNFVTIDLRQNRRNLSIADGNRRYPRSLSQRFGLHSKLTVSENRDPADLPRTTTITIPIRKIIHIRNGFLARFWECPASTRHFRTS